MLVTPMVIGNCHILCVEKDKQTECRVMNPDQCSDKRLVKYLNCNSLYINDIQKKECQ